MAWGGLCHGGVVHSERGESCEVDRRGTGHKIGQDRGHAPASGLASTVAPSGQVPDLAFNVRTRRPGTWPATAGRSARACLAASRRLLLYGTFLVAVLFTAIDGYEVSVHTAADARGNVAVSLTVRRDDVPVTDLEPYLGASGHLVGIHAGDLAYAHVHPKH